MLYVLLSGSEKYLSRKSCARYAQNLERTVRLVCLRELCQATSKD